MSLELIVTVRESSSKDTHGRVDRSGEKVSVSVNVQSVPCVHAAIVKVYADAPILYV